MLSTLGGRSNVPASFLFSLPSGSEFSPSLTALLTLVGVFLGGPVGAYMITRTASRSQVPFHEGTILDEWKTIEKEVTESHREN